MELPIAKQSYLPTTDALVRALKRADVILARMAAEEAQLDGATAFTNPRRPNVHMVNFAADLHVPEGAAAEVVLAEVVSHFRVAGTKCFILKSAEAGWPKPLAAAAEHAGYQPGTSAIYALERFHRPSALNPDLQVIPGRAAYLELRRFYHRGTLHEWTDARLADDMADTHIDFYDDPRVESFLGRLRGQPVGVVDVLTLGNIGVVTEVYTDHEHRRKGVARTLMTHALDFCHRALFERVILETAENSMPARNLYESLGFKLATLLSFYRLPEHV